jgi:predicted alpha/beta hydrolase family esterase
MLDTQIKFINVPGLNNSDDWHWQTLWEEQSPSNFVRVSQEDWDNPEKDKWVRSLKNTIENIKEPIVLVAHSLGCMTVAHYAQEFKSNAHILGALLVAPPDVEEFTNAKLNSFAPVPTTKLAFRSVVVGSTNDNYCTIDKAQKMADYWGSKFINIGTKGHINSDSDLGAWTQGKSLLRALIFNKD